MAGSDIAISRLAPTNSTAYQALVEVDRDGDGNGRISADELQHLSVRPGLTQANVNAVQATFANTLAPARASGVRSGGTIVPARGEVTESWGTAAKTLVLAAHAFPDIQVNDEGGNTVGTMTRRYDSQGVGDFFQNIFGATLTLKDNAGNVIAEAKPRIIDTKNIGNNFRTLIDIYDAEGTRVGTIRQTWESKGGSILQNMAIGGSIWTRYEVLDPNDNVVATSAKTEFFGTKLDVTGDTGHQARFERNFWQSMLHDVWNYSTDSNAQVDRRVLVFMAAYKTMADIQKRQKAVANAYGEILKAASQSK